MDGSWGRVNPRWFSCICHLIKLIVIVLSRPSHRPLFESSFIFLIVLSHFSWFTSQGNNCSEGPAASYRNRRVSCCKVDSRWRLETDPNPINPLIILHIFWVEPFIPGLFLSHSSSLEEEALDSCCSSVYISASERGRTSGFTPDCAAC